MPQLFPLFWTYFLFNKLGLGMSKKKCIAFSDQIFKILHLQQPIPNFKEGNNEYKLIMKLYCRNLAALTGVECGASKF